MRKGWRKEGIEGGKEEKRKEWTEEGRNGGR